MISAQTVSNIKFTYCLFSGFPFRKKLHENCSVYHLQDSVVMERLIEKYMSLPNQAWDNIVKEATRVS